MNRRDEMVLSDEKKLIDTLDEGVMTEDYVNQTEILSSLANAYRSMHYIDLEKGTINELETFEEIHSLYEENREICSVQQIINEAMHATVTEPFLKDMLEFVDFSTLSDRMKDKKIISKEFIGKIKGWTRANFIIVRRDENASPTAVIFTTRIVDEEKRKEQMLERIARADGLTKLFNRHAYEDDIDRIVDEGLDELVFVAMDLNGLKSINDSMGHAAGDEFIQNAASCMLNVFKNHGRVYRTGGDEFVALLRCSEDEIDEIIKNFDKEISECRGELVSDISVARGIVSNAEFPEYTIEQLEKKADERMYLDKYQYYITHPTKSMGRDKALIEEVLRALSSNYESILFVDLANKRINAYRKSSRFTKRFWEYVESNPPWEELLEYFIKRKVYSADKNRVRELTTLSNIIRNLRINSAYSIEFRINVGGGPAWSRVKIAKINNNTQMLTVGFENIAEEKNDDEAYYQIGNKILIFDSDSKQIKALANFLKNEYDVIVEADLKSAKETVEKEYEDIVAIIVDVGDANKDGYLFIDRISNTRKYSAIPIIAASEHNRKQSELKALEYGASDFMNKPYNEEVVRHYIKSLARLRSSVAMLNTLEKDPLTGLYNKEFFMKRADEILSSDLSKNYKVVVLDVQKFKVVNEKYGIEMGNAVLKHIAAAGKKYIPNTVIAGRLSGDKFVYLQENISHSREEGMQMVNNLLKDSPVQNLVFKVGIFYTEMDRFLTAQAMCDRARLASESIKSTYGVYCAVYDDKLRKDLLVQQQVLENMDEALKKGQFKVFLQPKHDLKMNRTGGAEALVRWIHPELGFMSPGVFIPLFEQNGFVKEVDAFVLERVCETLDRWIKEGRKLVPISVNLSRRDFEDSFLAQKLSRTVDDYNIPHEMIHFELTESAFSDNPELITSTIKVLHDNGFVIELDDFGTGYSSLTTLSNIDFDILKLDMSIIQNDDPDSERNVLNFCAQLVKMMNLQSVAEGVETKAQVERMTSLGCDYIQGFFYSKPLPIEEFEKYIDDNN